MAGDPEALTQLARLLGDSSLRSADIDAAQAAIERGIDRLTEGLYAEALASDDVVDTASSIEFIEDRLRFLGALLTPGQRSRLFDALRGKIEAW